MEEGDIRHVGANVAIGPSKGTKESGGTRHLLITGPSWMKPTNQPQTHVHSTHLFGADRVGGELFDEVLGHVLDLAIQHCRAPEREHRVESRHESLRRVEQQHETLDGPRVDADLHGFQSGGGFRR